MTKEISTSDTERGVVERKENGELMPERHEVDLPHGETVEIKTKPITTGLLNELSGIDDAIADLDPDAVHEAFQTIYISDALRNMTVDEIRDTKAPYLTAYLEPLNEAVEEEIGEREGNPGQMAGNQPRTDMRT